MRAVPGSCRGFTLIEILIVIAVLSILAAVLFPVMAAVRRKARQTTCAAHLKQVAQAGQLYLQDYDERLPSCWLSTQRPVGFDLNVALQPYARSADLFYCPERRTVSAECLDPWGRWGVPIRCMGYGYNWGSALAPLDSAGKEDGLVRHSAAFRVVVGVLLSEVAQPSRCLFAGDTNDSYLLALRRESMPGVAQPKPDGTGVFVPEPPRHSGGNNFAFVDGHVQWLPFPGGKASDGGPQVVPDMSIYSRTGRWEDQPVP
jgi:prepilin-type N-terminal cleavage/methylation domain-containing protein/prepilin-type processing-associated H-X9-DG protein